MYYIKKSGKVLLCGRGPVFDDPYDELEDFRMFDYDDMNKWSDDALDFEYKRVSIGKNYDPFAMSAINGEKDRRAGKLLPPWFDDLNEMLDDFELAANENIDYLEDVDDIDDIDDIDDMDDLEDDWDEERKPILSLADVSASTVDLIRKLAVNERRRWEYNGKIPDSQAEMIRREKVFEEDNLLRMELMNSPFADDLVDELDPVEDMKIVAAHLMFLYAQERQIAEQEGRKADEDYFYAAANLYNYAAITQILIEDEDFDD